MLEHYNNITNEKISYYYFFNDGDCNLIEGERRFIEKSQFFLFLVKTYWCLEYPLKNAFYPVNNNEKKHQETSCHLYSTPHSIGNFLSSRFFPTHIQKEVLPQHWNSRQSLMNEEAKRTCVLHNWQIWRSRGRLPACGRTNFIGRFGKHRAFNQSQLRFVFYNWESKWMRKRKKCSFSIF